MSMLAAAAAALTITVRVYDLYGLPPDHRAKALAHAAETLAQANVTANWIDCARDEHGVVPPPCLDVLRPGELVVRIMDRTKRGNHILGTAIVQEGGPNVICSIYAESVAERSMKSGVPNVTLLGRVTAHEIGHLLLGTNSHAPSGIMRASWNLKVPHPIEWQFTSADAAKIRSRMLAHSEGEVAAGRQLDE
jgi:hypothetical protein